MEHYLEKLQVRCVLLAHCFQFFEQLSVKEASVKTRDYYIALSFMLIEYIREQSVLEYGVEAIGPDF